MKLKFITLTSLLMALIPLSVSAAPAQTKTSLGIDISYPQCGSKFPTSYAFGIVGVNGGLATTPNACLDQQLIWANKATGGTKQEKVQLYVNTANPGGLNTESWPQDNIDPQNNFIINPYTLCDGSDSLACAWQYGWNRANEDVNKWFMNAASKAKIDSQPQKYIWWLDVEMENTWKTDKSTFSYQSNVAVLEGMNEYFLQHNIRTGLYTTAYQWSVITGDVIDSTSNLNGLPNWRPGGASLATAKQACGARPLTTGGNVVLTQYTSRGIDYNYSCVQ